MTDPNVFVAVAAIVTLFLQFLIGAYFYGGLSQKVKNIADAAEEWRNTVRQDFKEVKEEIRSLRYFRSYPKRDGQ